jgi:hypothetical protein
MIQNVREKFYPELRCQKEHSTKEDSFAGELDLNLKKKLPMKRSFEWC